MTSSNDILERFRVRYGRDIDLTLRDSYRVLLNKLGNPQNHLPPTIQIAGTNGKGSTTAFLRAILEATGRRVHVYTSPHLVTIHERIRVAGSLISESDLAAILTECETLSPPGAVSFFEASTAAAFTAFARTVADVALIEVGLGGRLDATNVIDHPAATAITRLSFDHREYLGDTLDAIAREKAGVMKQNTPCYAAFQPDETARTALIDEAEKHGTPLHMANRDWHVTETPTGFRFENATRRLDLPRPALIGRHQIQNAGLAIATALSLPFPIEDQAFTQAMRTVSWPARLQKIETGALRDFLPASTELWLDGGHNDSAGEALATQIEDWKTQDGASPRPLYVLFGMLSTKNPQEFLSPFAPSITALRTVPIENEPLGQTPALLAEAARQIGVTSAEACATPIAALQSLAATAPAHARILICGSLYLAGHILRLNNTPPT